MYILLVDDEPLIRDTIGTFLSLSGHQVLYAENIHEAQLHVQQSSGQIDLLLTDVCMPGGTGIQLLEQLRANQPDIDAIMMTGYSDQLDARQALEVGASAFLRKPVRMADLELLISQIDRARKDRTRIQYLNRSLRNERNLRKENEQDRLFARRLRSKMFPKDFSWLRRTEVVLRHLPMAGIGGDYADLRPYGDGRALIFVGDVSGHGTPAAFGGMALKTWFQTVPLGLSPVEVMAHGDAMMLEVFPEEFYATALCGIWHERERQLQYVVAGHVPPIVVSPNASPRLLAGDGPALGMALQGDRQECTVCVQESEALLIATDGLCEQPADLLAGLQRKLHVYPRDLAQMARVILDTAIEAAPVRAFADDLTVLLLGPKSPRDISRRSLQGCRAIAWEVDADSRDILERHGIIWYSCCQNSCTDGEAVDLIVIAHHGDRQSLEHRLRHCRRCCGSTPLLLLLQPDSRIDVKETISAGMALLVQLPCSEQALATAAQQAINLDPTSDSIAFDSVADDWFDFVISSSPAAVDLLSRYLEALGRQPIPAAILGDVVYCVREMATNAIEWGNLHDPDLRVRVSTVLLQDRVMIKIADEGGGFDAVHLFDPSRVLAEQERRERIGKRDGGFGLSIVQSLMDRVAFNARGNVVLLTKFFSRSEADDGCI